MLFQSVLPQGNARWFYSLTPATDAFIHILNVLDLDCAMVWGNCIMGNSVYVGLIGALPFAPPMSDESWLSSCSSDSSEQSPGYRGKSVIPMTCVCINSAGGWNHFIGKPCRCLPGTPGGGPGEWVELEDVGHMAGFFHSGAGGSLGAPGENGQCSECSMLGNIWDLP